MARRRVYNFADPKDVELMEKELKEACKREMAELEGKQLEDDRKRAIEIFHRESPNGRVKKLLKKLFGNNKEGTG